MRGKIITQILRIEWLTLPDAKYLPGNYVRSKVPNNLNTIFKSNFDVFVITILTAATHGDKTIQYF